MKLGAFSVSLAVKDLQASYGFYQKLGFEKIGGNGDNYLILKNGETIIGLFMGMFENNILTFNPGWDTEQNTLADFEDVREIRDSLLEQGVELKEDHTQEKPSGPAHLVLTDPDGNAILIDQHTTKPGS